MPCLVRFAFIATALVISAVARGAAAAVCEVGAYRGPSGDFVVIVETADTAKSGAWRYSFRDGRYGSTRGGPVQCVEGAVLVSGPSAPAARWPRIALRTTATRFDSGGVVLAGLLIEPPDARARPPLVVLVHGSERTPWIRRANAPYLLAAQGVAAFIYDKRGTGASGGTYHQNFARLADDVVAAAGEAKRLANGRFGRFGLFGGSQGGWVAPRAANASGAQFVVVAFGLVVSPLEEDAEQVQGELVQLGYGADTLAKAREVTDATGAVIASHFTSGYEELARIRRAYGAEPWFSRIKGEVTGDVLGLDETTLRGQGRTRLDDLDIDWRYDAVGELRKVKAPQLWIVADADREAPSARTLEVLEGLRREGQQLEIAVFPDTDHGIMEFTRAPDGTRTMTRVAEGYFRLRADWIKQERHPPYGKAVFPYPQPGRGGR